MGFALWFFRTTIHSVSFTENTFHWPKKKKPELWGVCPNMSYPVEIFYPKREIIFTFSKINFSIDSRPYPDHGSGNTDGQAKGLAEIPRNIGNNHQLAWLFSFPRVCLPLAVLKMSKISLSHKIFGRWRCQLNKDGKAKVSTFSQSLTVVLGQSLKPAGAHPAPPAPGLTLLLAITFVLVTEWKMESETEVSEFPLFLDAPGG